MSTKSLIIVILSLLFMTICVDVLAKSRGVSIVQLLVAPKEYAGDRVIVHGFAREFGGFIYLFLTKDDATLMNRASAIRVEDISEGRALVNDELCHNVFVKIIGIFNIIESVGLYGITDVEQVTRYDLTQAPIMGETCWSNRQK